MAVVVPNAGELELLDKMLKDALNTNEDYTLKLNKNNVTPDETTSAGAYTEADFTNYAAKTLTRANFSAAATVDGKARSSYNTAQTWTCGATGNTIYGYYIIGATSGTVLWCEKFPTPQVLASGDTLTMTPVFTGSSEN